MHQELKLCVNYLLNFIFLYHHPFKCIILPKVRQSSFPCSQFVPVTFASNSGALVAILAFPMSRLRAGYQLRPGYRTCLNSKLNNSIEIAVTPGPQRNGTCRHWGDANTELTPTVTLPRMLSSEYLCTGTHPSDRPAEGMLLSASDCHGFLDSIGLEVESRCIDERSPQQRRVPCSLRSSNGHSP